MLCCFITCLQARYMAAVQAAHTLATMDLSGAPHFQLLILTCAAFPIRLETLAGESEGVRGQGGASLQPDRQDSADAGELHALSSLAACVIMSVSPAVRPAPPQARLLDVDAACCQILERHMQSHGSPLTHSAIVLRCSALCSSQPVATALSGETAPRRKCTLRSPRAAG
jgi:hypothetical protein